MTSKLAIAALVLAGCEWGGGPGPTPSSHSAAARPNDSKPMAAASPDVPDNDAPVIDSATPTTDHLLLTELAVAPDGAELIEIYNPLSFTVDLKDYYLSNHGSYFKLPVAGQSMPFAHFIVRFPNNASIKAGEVITVATQGAAPFMQFYGVPPTYSITDNTMVNVEVSNTPRLTDSGATVILFHWDGTSGLVQDVDIMVVGQPSLTNVLIDKSGVMQNGMTYKTDANTIAAQTSAPGIDQSTKRIKREAANETETGGNGITGHDETSEKTDVTWDASFSAPTPGAIPAL
ncbi:MAG TPA: hypothetical protein VL326_23775 [Kofleriaceae bacterium]|nr:hypothetical protein [Kofleriaceae bacterium]